MPKKRPQKLLVYLDQNFVSDMAKPANARVKPEIRELYTLLHDAFLGEKLVVVQSIFHDVETSLAGPLRKPIRSRQSTLGHVELEHPLHVKECQIARAIARHLGHADAGDVICHEDVLGDDPDRRVPHFDIGVDTDWQSVGAGQQRAALATQLDKVRRRIFENSTTFEEQVAIEMSSMKELIAGPSSAPVFAAAAGVSIDQLIDFVASAAFEKTPIVRLEVELLARLMTAYANRPIKRGDVSDLDAMAAYLPYCDVYGADGLTADVARRQRLEEAYGCRLFDSRKDGVGKLIDHLTAVLTSKAPVNRPALSLFVAPNTDVKEKAFAFFKELGSQARMANNRCGAWVELFGLDDGAMPQYLDQSIGRCWPFYGLQEVREVSCSATDDREALINVCRKMCRSSHFVFVDTWQALPADFVMTALAAQRSGASRVQQYEICSAE